MKKTLASLFFTMISLMVFATEYNVANEAELNSANKKAAPGDVIILKEGIWKNVQIKITCNGTKQAPINVRGTAYSSTIISGASNLKISGNFVIVSNLVFENGHAAKSHVWSFSNGDDVANDSRITHCKIVSFNNVDRMEENHWVTFSGQRNRLDHCAFVDKTNIGVLIAVLMDDERSRNSFHSIDSNYFGLRRPLGSNGGEMIRVGVSQHCTFNSNTDIHDNYFEQCSGETEIISIKSCGNKVRNNVFKECQGSVVLRHGNGNLVESNIFLGNGKSGTGGVRIINEDNMVVNNFFYECVGTVFRSPLAIMNGVFNSPPNRYLPVKNALVANNTYFNCSTISIGEGADEERSVAPSNVFMFNNLFYSNTNKTLSFVKSSTAGVFLKNNVSSTFYTDSLGKTMNKSDIYLKRAKYFTVPVTNQIFDVTDVPTDIQQRLARMLTTTLSTNVGTIRYEAYEKMIEGGEALKAMLYQHKVEGNYFELARTKCSTAVEVYAALAEAKPVAISLTSKNYEFSQPLEIKAPVSFTSDGKTVSFLYTGTDALFKMFPESRLSIRNSNFKNVSLGQNAFIMSGAGGANSHLNISISKSEFENMDFSSFIVFEKSAYADNISITGSSFKNTTGNFLVLDKETDAKGYYNVEILTLEGNSFKNHTGQLMSIYRTGNDESTMGPILTITNNNFKNVTALKPVIDLYGVQKSLVQGNNIKNVNAASIFIQYADKVQAIHTLGKNNIKNSGEISTDAFVNDLSN